MNTIAHKASARSLRVDVLKIALILFAVLLTAAPSCRKGATRIPTGTWNYRLLVNGAPLGSAVVSNTVSDGRYVSTTDMQMDAGYVKNSTRVTVIETLEFKPVRLESCNRTVQNGQESEMKTVASFSGGRVDLDTGESKSVVNIKKPFVLEGNYFMNELIKAGFRQGTVIQHLIYEPSVDIEEPVLVLLKVIGREDVRVNDKKMNLIHLGFSMENMKNIDSYIDDNGVTQKTIITMLNNRLELILE